VAIVRATAEGLALRSLLLKGEQVISTQLYLAEIDSVLAKYVRAGLLNRQAARELLIAAVELVDGFISMDENHIEAFDEGLRHNHSTYDMFYLTLARRYGATLFTLDKRLIAICEQLKIDCAHVIEAN
jgi:predicted nucleic acid-binding protein